MSDKKIFPYPELGFTVAAWMVNEAVMCFAVYEITSEDDDRLGYTAKKGTLSKGHLITTTYDMAEDVSLAEAAASGSLKWDGCIDFIMGEDGGYHHFCDRARIIGFGKVLAKIYDIGNEMMPGHNEYLD